MPTGLPGLSTDAISSNHYSFEVDGVSIAKFQEVSGIGAEVDVIELKENLPDGKFIIHKVPGNPKYNPVTIKRAKTTSTDLWDWYQKVLDGKIADFRKNASLVLYSYDGEEVSRWNLTNVWPSKITISALKSNSTEFAVEEGVLQHEGMHRAK